MRRQRRKRENADRCEQKAHADTLYDTGFDQCGHAHVRRELRHLPQRKGRNHKPNEQEQPRIDTIDQAADDEHRQHRAETARREHITRHQNRITEHVDARDEHKNHAGAEIAVFEHGRFDERPRLHVDVHDEHVKADDRDQTLDDDFGRLEPQLRIAAIEHQLQRTDGETEVSKSGNVEWPFTVSLRILDRCLDTK
jgi:hypothetical protein